MFAVTMFTANDAVKNIGNKINIVESVKEFSYKEQFVRYSHNHSEVLEAYGRFEEALNTSGLSEKEMALVLDAAVFAAKKHHFQTRKNVEQVPYIIHPIGVATNILTIAKHSDAKVLAAALLHDTVEDTKTSFTEIQERYGIEVAGYVQELTDDKALPKKARKELQIINASHKSNGAVYIKLSDKLYNLTDISNGLPIGWNQKRADEYFKWAKQVVDQLPPVSPELKGAIDQVSSQYWNKNFLN